MNTYQYQRRDTFTRTEAKSPSFPLPLSAVLLTHPFLVTVTMSKKNSEISRSSDRIDDSSKESHGAVDVDAELYPAPATEAPDFARDIVADIMKILGTEVYPPSDDSFLLIKVRVLLNDELFAICLSHCVPRFTNFNITFSYGTAVDCAASGEGYLQGTSETTSHHFGNRKWIWSSYDRHNASLSAFQHYIFLRG